MYVKRANMSQFRRAVKRPRTQETAAGGLRPPTTASEKAPPLQTRDTDPHRYVTTRSGVCRNCLVVPFGATVSASVDACARCGIAQFHASGHVSTGDLADDLRAIVLRSLDDSPALRRIEEALRRKRSR